MQNSKQDFRLAGRKRPQFDHEGNEQHEPELQSRKSSLHMQNQERAYIAASRRTDRSLEARYQSALMASAIHKKRTGKGFRVTHEIVQSEDMYEEEEGLLESTTSLNAYRGRTWSQTDAYIAALIARKSGMHLCSAGEQTPLAPAYDTVSGQQPPVEQSVPQSVQQSIGYEAPGDDFDHFSGLDNYNGPNLGDGTGTNLDPCFAGSGPVPEVPSLIHASSSGSSMSTLLFDSNYSLGSSSHSMHQRCDLLFDFKLEDCLTGTDGEGYLKVAQDEPAIESR
ncbi:hypothetical protein BBAD15_g12098 [Beauveria bassiana D1-5]|uniref:Uncharacterized protein n=1 Tax=Beauveria bassiana D1-5 TaxID=1245745 RepID=A0A0A2V4J7_BEABA|nr:hypothetical protein BBAD15_g12098 [Beauveria bassiana D1-5]